METKIIAGLLIAGGIALGGFFPGYYYYQAQMNNRTVTVKGLAEKDVKADLAVWDIKFKTTGNDLTALQRTMENHLNVILAYLKERGFGDSEIIVGRMNTNDLMTNPYRDDKASACLSLYFKPNHYCSFSSG